MTSQSDERRGRTTCAVEVSPDVVDAGAEMTLQCKVSCSPVCNLQGQILVVKDHAGADVALAELARFDSETNTTSELVVRAPVEAGDHTWLVVCPAVVKDGVSYLEAVTPISFTVTPHVTHVVAWDIPSAIVVGERFRMKVGMKCPHECNLTHAEVGIYDHEGTRVAMVTLPGDCWPGTTGLYVAEVECEAPAGEGLYTWRVEGPRADFGIPHVEGALAFGVRVVRQPEYLVTVETVDEATQTPLGGARVVMHPYKAVSDERGVAQVRVAKGTYRLFVSQTKYLTFGLPLEVTADMTARAELCLEPEPERN